MIARENQEVLQGPILLELALVLSRPLPIANRHVEVLEALACPAGLPAYNDPFDRIMIAQAEADGLIFLTHDARIAEHDESCVLWV